MEKVKKVERRFAEGYCFKKIFFLFLIGCIVGTYYEEILMLFEMHKWVNRSGLIYGPFNPVYGLGFILFVVLLGKNYKTRPWYVNYLLSCLVGGITEFGLSWFEEVAFHAESWDYTGYFLNIGGRTTIPFMLVWGLGGMLILYVIYPWLSSWIERIPVRIGNRLYPIILIFMILNMCISYSALFRLGMRNQGKPPMTIVGEMLDTVYPDEFLHKAYPNLVVEK
ncbi:MULTISPECIES: putative ABC transporter permease [Breznakia]|uniref:Putative ABC transporter type IV n=1 Tax=Breznakia blatticola TaxID=1754012 RepID=A0A4R7ZT62_9FIRM|nr:MULTISPECIES: putative ABC transporter permease [Breznakia]MDH6366448.1 putative membrane protein [Breznakia sp. PH1-1]MDH6403541.1 putative membrane protein [Breznakia sp. PF1-11]MDH6411250.1 putative membrane protein [Breznakia sp. PFB1-11]MDH6413487.1 putative membrane protein [Breznakia sp. PFB1-14]MDH6415795.1 putative membrane protein [Breznakia sp. PFB1-4]